MRAVTNGEIIAGEAARCSSRAAHGADSRFARRRPVKKTPAFTGPPLNVVSRGAREADRASSVTRVGCGTGGLDVFVVVKGDVSPICLIFADNGYCPAVKIPAAGRLCNHEPVKGLSNHSSHRHIAGVGNFSESFGLFFVN